ncbi:M15 family metallopeptidase [Aequorivita capsosiphonis]|uniref:M15 family metallopeptidase n=1 Tax=Aequorivita capsosiphonis TaxID=487317 RepID=UPI000424E1ED|nr:M15 family metallopeptidase [Aequorivita capsosiphonis]
MFLKKQNFLLVTFILCFVLLISSCAVKPPQEKGNFQQTDLVELIKLDPTLKLDIRYAGSNNFVGRPVYTEARAFLQRPAALQLVKVNKELEPLGYGLIIFDGYRPWSVTKVFWDITSKEDKKFVANPKQGSRHNRGCAVDLTLLDLSTGKPVAMTGEYDEMTERSYPEYEGGTAEQREMRDLLRSKMEAHGFKVYEFEWWHFDFQGWESYRIQNIPFSEIE